VAGVANFVRPAQDERFFFSSLNPSLVESIAGGGVA